MDHPDDNFTRFPVETSGGIKFINLNGLDYCRSCGSYTDFIMEDPSENFDSSYPLGEWERRLPRGRFCRISDSHLVNKDKIDRYMNAKDGTVILKKSGEELTVSRLRKKNFFFEMGYAREVNKGKKHKGVFSFRVLGFCLNID
ncbi:MAG: LytTR family DNA-binding domain-containing protein [Bacteroidota bacterium]